MLQDITVVILTQNNESTLARTLESVSGFPVIVIDGGSIDRTIEVAKSFNAQIITRPFDQFATQRNAGLSFVKTSWCLMLDSDEAVTQELKAELIKITNENDTKILYRIMRTEYLLGEENEYGYGRSDYQERFFKTEFVNYEGLLHEYPVIRGRKPKFHDADVGIIDSTKRLLHNPENNFTLMINRIPSYNKIKAQEKIAQGSTTSISEIVIIYFFSFFQIFFRRWRAGRIAFFEAMINSINRVLVKLLIYEAQLLAEKKKNQ